jgi:hypothetical protein
VVPPLALENSLHEKIKQHYSVQEAMRLDLGLLKDPKHNLILSSSFDGLIEAKKSIPMKLVVYSLNEKSSKTCADNYYLGLDDFYANEKLRKASFSGLTIRTHVEKMLKSLNQI